MRLTVWIDTILFKNSLFTAIYTLDLATEIYCLSSLQVWIQTFITNGLPLEVFATQETSIDCWSLDHDHIMLATFHQVTPFIKITANLVPSFSSFEAVKFCGCGEFSKSTLKLHKAIETFTVVLSNLTWDCPKEIPRGVHYILCLRTTCVHDSS